MSFNLLLLTGLLSAVTLDKIRGEGEIRLVNGSDGLEGRVEIFQDGIWGTVCDDNWSIKNAHVVCYQLGLGHAVSAYGKGYFRSGTGPIAMDEVDCVGDEERLDQCPFRGWFSHNCVHQEDAGVRCSTEDGAIRLVGGNTPYEGRVEIFHGGNWGSICDEGWDTNNAIVVCRKLGLGFPEMEVSDGYYGEGKGDILLSNVTCEGTENGLEECIHPGFLRHTCGRNQEAGVQCSPSEDLAEELCKNFEVRVVDHPAGSESQVEICYKGIWGTVCGDSWGKKEAFVACRQLGYDNLVSFYSFDTTNNANNHIVENLICEENQSLLLNCDITFGNPKCTSTAAVRCSGKSPEVINTNCTTGTVRLVGGDAYYNGKVEVCSSGIWVDFYVVSWGSNENHVICKMLGYSGATGFVLSQPLPYFKEASVTSVLCLPYATTLSQCLLTSYDGNGLGFEVYVACEPAFSGIEIFWVVCMCLSGLATALSFLMLCCGLTCLCLVWCCCEEELKKARQRQLGK